MSQAKTRSYLCTSRLKWPEVKKLSALGRRAGVMQMKVPAAHHRLVSLAIMETFVRYNRVLQHSQHCLPSVLQTFLGDNGIGHPDKVTDRPTPSSPVYPPYRSALHHSKHFLPGMLQACLVNHAIIHPGKGPSWNYVLVPTFACCVRSRMQSAPFDHAPAAELLRIILHVTSLHGPESGFNIILHPMRRLWPRGHAICSAGWRRACGRTCGRC